MADSNLDTRSVNGDLVNVKVALESSLNHSWYVPRLKASALHLILSLLVVCASTALLVASWYPGALLFAAGGTQLLILIVSVDLILGPLLTFVVFDRRKKSLAFDLSFIVVLQLCALAYGMYASYQGRPVFQVFAVDRFELMSAAEVDAAQLEKAPAHLSKLSSSGPVLVAALLPTEESARKELVLAASSGLDLKHFMRFYVDYETQRVNVLAASKPVAELRQFNTTVAVERALASVAENQAAIGLRFVPLLGKREDLAVIIDPVAATPIAVVRLRPWQE